MDIIKKHVEASRKAFNARLHTPEYREVHGDEAHRERLLQFISGEDLTRLLDLGTGDGYMAFEMAKRWPNRSIVGLDVAGKSIARNRKVALEQGLKNLSFFSYDGVEFPFKNEKFDCVICRYAFHHCPQPKTTIVEISRVLNTKGMVVLSDPVPSTHDDGKFIDEFQKLQPDGHHCFHPRETLVDWFSKTGFVVVDTFESSITGVRPSDARYEKLLAGTPNAIRDAYRISVKDGEITFTLKVLNSLCQKSD